MRDKRKPWATLFLSYQSLRKRQLDKIDTVIQVSTQSVKPTLSKMLLLDLLCTCCFFIICQFFAAMVAARTFITLVREEENIIYFAILVAKDTGSILE